MGRYWLLGVPLPVLLLIRAFGGSITDRQVSREI